MSGRRWWIGLLIAAGLMDGCQRPREKTDQVIATAGATAPEPPPPPSRTPLRRWHIDREFERINRCTVRVRLLSAPEIGEMLDDARRILDGATATRLVPTAYADRIAMLEVGAVPPPRPPASAAEAAALMHEAMVRYRLLFGLVGQALTELSFTAAQAPNGVWTAEDHIEDNGGRGRVVITLSPSGALRSIRVSDTPPWPPPGAICAAPALALDDPRVRAAVIGRSATFSDYVGRPRTVTFKAADIGAIGTAVIQPTPDQFRRVITVEVGRLAGWTVFLDADTAAFIAYQQNFRT